MKIKKIEINNFRAYRNEEVEIELDKNIILLYGNNGYGKTSFFDSIEWGITGKIKRFEENLSEANNFKFLKNRFSSEEVEGKVRLTFTDDFYIERKIKETEKEDYKENILHYPSDNIEVYKKIFVDEDKSNIFNESFNFLYLLSQELITDFIKRDKEQERYKKISNLFGMIEENKYKSLFSEKRKNIKLYFEEIKEEINFLNEKKNKYEKLITKDELKNIDKNLLSNGIKLEELIMNNNINLIQLQDLIRNKEIKINILKEADFYKSEIEEIKKLREELFENEINLDNLKKYNQIKTYEKLVEENKNYEAELINIKTKLQFNPKYNLIFEYLEIYLNKNKNREYYIKNIGPEIESIYLNKEDIQINTLVTAIIEIEKEIKINENFVKENEEILKNTLELEGLFYEVSKRIIAEKNIEKYCPLCNQKVEDINIVLSKLELKKSETLEKIQKAIDQKNININTLKQNSIELSKKIDSKIENGVNLLLEQERLRKSLENLTLIIKKIKEEQENIRLKLNLTEKEIMKKKTELERIKFSDEKIYELEIGRIRILINQKESINLKKYIEISNQETLEKLEKKLVDLKLNLKQKKDLEIKYQNLEIYFKNLENNQEIKKLSEKILEKESERLICEKLIQEFRNSEKASKEYIENKTEQKFETYKQSINYLYSLLNPHKKFNNIDFLASNKKIQNSKLTIQIEDQNLNIKSNPAYILSSAQSNNLAIAIFLGINLTSNNLKLKSIFLDDPIQNMDDINIYSFTEIIKQMSLMYDKQIFISTHDDRIANYIKTKLKGKVQMVKLQNYGEIQKMD